MTEAKRRRETRYTDTVAVRISPEMKARLEALADRDDLALGIILRQVIDAGLSKIANPVPEVPNQIGDKARVWWGELPKRERSRWGRELKELEGAAFLQEAYQQAMNERNG